MLYHSQFGVYVGQEKGPSCAAVWDYYYNHILVNTFKRELGLTCWYCGIRGDG